MIPQRMISCMRKASAVRKIEPTLWVLLTLSNTKIIGVFLAFLNSSTSNRLSSAFLSLRMIQKYNLIGKPFSKANKYFSKTTQNI